jgi:stress response protein YsnF
MVKPTLPRDGRRSGKHQAPVPDEALRSEARTKSGEIVPLVEETASVRKREANVGKVRLRTITDTVEELAQAYLQSESVEVIRVPVDRAVETIPSVRTENDVTIVSVLEEILVVEKRLVLKEEQHIRRRVETQAVEVPVTVCKQRAIVERLAPDDPPNNDKETSQ